MDVPSTTVLLELTGCENGVKKKRSTTTCSTSSAVQGILQLFVLSKKKSLKNSKEKKAGMLGTRMTRIQNNNLTSRRTSDRSK